MLKGGKHLPVNFFLDKKFINDNLKVVFLIGIKFNFLADVMFNTVNSDVSTSLRTDVVEEVVIIFTVNFEDRCVNLDLGSLRQ